MIKSAKAIIYSLYTHETDSQIVCFATQLIHSETNILQRSFIYLTYISFLEIPFKSVNLEISKTKSKILIFITCIATAGYLTVGAVLKHTLCFNNEFPYLSVLVLICGGIDVVLCITLLVLYLIKLKNLKSLINTRSSYIERATLEELRHQNRLRSIVLVAKKHTQLVFITIFSAWVLTIVPFVLTVKFFFFFFLYIFNGFTKFTQNL